MAGLTSTLGVLISAINSQARLIFNAGRERLLPAWLGKVNPKHQTPVNALLRVHRHRRASSSSSGCSAT